MPHGYDLTRTGSKDVPSLVVGGVPREVWSRLLEETLGEAAAFAGREDEGLLGKDGIDGAETGWRSVATPLAWESTRRWERLDLRLFAGAPSPAAWGEDPPPGALLTMRSDDGALVVTLESPEPDLLRMLLGGILAQAFRAGERRPAAVAIPDGVIERVWDGATGGVHWNPNRKVQEGDDLVLTGNLGRDFHVGARGPRPESVQAVRLVLDPGGGIRWEGPAAMPRPVYVREHLDSWPGCLAPLGVAVVGLLLVVVLGLVGKSCLGSGA